MLRDGPLSVCQMAAVLDAPVSTVSGHLLELRRAELVVERRKGKWVYYGLASSTPVASLLGPVLAAIADDPDVRRDAAKAAALHGTSPAALCARGGRSRPTGAAVTAVLVALLALWVVIYRELAPFATWLTYDAIGLTSGTRLASAVEFFAYDTPKVLMLLLLVVFGVGRRAVVLHAGADATPASPGGARSSGNVMAALLGIVTPFCSCSAVPLFIGFVTAGVPLGVTFSFLISAPMVNEVALVLLFGLFGWRIAGAVRSRRALAIAIVARLDAGPPADWSDASSRGCWPRARQRPRTTSPLGSTTASPRDGEAVRDIVGRVWPYVLAGIAVGAAIHGYVPEHFMASIMGKDAWWAVPLGGAASASRCTPTPPGIVPVVQALLEKGAALGTVLAFMMAVIGLSFPEMIILRKVLKRAAHPDLRRRRRRRHSPGGLPVQRDSVGGGRDGDAAGPRHGMSETARRWRNAPNRPPGSSDGITGWRRSPTSSRSRGSAS